MMNNEFFENVLMSKIGVNESEVKVINQVLEENSIIGRKSKENIINSFMELLKVDEIRANEIYNLSMDIIKNSIKEKLKHPFKSLD